MCACLPALPCGPDCTVWGRLFRPVCVPAWTRRWVLQRHRLRLQGWFWFVTSGYFHHTTSPLCSSEPQHVAHATGGQVRLSSATPPMTALHACRHRQPGWPLHALPRWHLVPRRRPPALHLLRLRLHLPSGVHQPRRVCQDTAGLSRWPVGPQRRCVSRPVCVLPWLGIQSRPFRCAFAECIAHDPSSTVLHMPGLSSLSRAVQ